MKNIYSEIQKLFESGEIQTIKFSKTGKVSVKFKKEPRLVTYKKDDNVIQTISDDAKVRESLEVVTMKPKLKMSVDEFVKLNTIEAEVFTSGISNKIPELMSKFKKSRFERFYDAIGNFIGGGKSFAPNELKPFV